MEHSRVKVDINDTTYISVKNAQFNGVFRWITYGDIDSALLVSTQTLRDAPTGWVDGAEEYLEDEGFNVI